MRHNVNQQAGVQFRSFSTPDRMAQLGKMDAKEVDAIAYLLSNGTPFNDRIWKDKRLSPVARELVESFRQMASRVPGSPAANMKVRRDVLSSVAVWGHYTLFFNLNPFEMSAQLVFEMAGKKHTFDLDGFPKDRPDLWQAWQMVANNPVATMTHQLLFIHAFCEVFAGWTIGDRKQRNPNCALGLITAFHYQIETSTRGALHFHGQARPICRRAPAAGPLPRRSGPGWVTFRLTCPAGPFPPIPRILARHTRLPSLACSQKPSGAFWRGTGRPQLPSARPSPTSAPASCARRWRNRSSRLSSASSRKGPLRTRVRRPQRRCGWPRTTSPWSVMASSPGRSSAPRTDAYRSRQSRCTDLLCNLSLTDVSP